MAYDSAATKARLLDAAYAEFVEHGLAGARVDRIAAAASANKQAIYLYFGSKDALFDTVLDTRLKILADVVPFTPGDLPGYAGALFDYLDNDPGLLRLTQWKALERPDASEAELLAHQSKAQELAAERGVEEEIGTDILMLALAAAQAWGNTASAIRNPEGAPVAERRDRHRRAVIASVAALTDTTPASR
jgi:AcrR family transcriptional regulator